MTATTDPAVAVLWVGLVLVALFCAAWLWDAIQDAVDRRNRRQMREWRRRMERR